MRSFPFLAVLVVGAMALAPSQRVALKPQDQDAPATEQQAPAQQQQTPTQQQQAPAQQQQEPAQQQAPVQQQAPAQQQAPQQQQATLPASDADFEKAAQAGPLNQTTQQAAAANAEASQEEQARQAIASIDTSGFTAFVISDEERFTQERVDQLGRLGFSNVERVDPVMTDLTCVDQDRGATGCYFAHRKAWRRVAALGQRAVIFETDWSIGNQNETHVADVVKSAMDRTEDWVSIGYCGLPPDGSGCPGGVCGGDDYDASGRPLQCLLSYSINPELVPSLLAYNVCSVPEEAHTAPNADWFLDHLCEHGQISCYFVAGPPPLPGCYGQGVFQQDMSFSGVHDAEHDQQTQELGKHDSGSTGSARSGKLPRVRRSKYDKAKVASWFERQGSRLLQNIQMIASKIKRDNPVYRVNKRPGALIGEVHTSDKSYSTSSTNDIK